MTGTSCRRRLPRPILVSCRDGFVKSFVHLSTCISTGGGGCWVIGSCSSPIVGGGPDVYQTVLEVIRFDLKTSEATAMSGFGPGADWLRNIEANGQLEVSIGGSTFLATYRVLEVTESVRVFDEYERRNILVRPVIRAVLGRLVGWPFDGSDAARHRLADQLPMVAFRPLNR